MASKHHPVEKDLPKSIISPLTNDILYLSDITLSVAYFSDDCTDCVDPFVALYKNDKTHEGVYIPYEPNE